MAKFLNAKATLRRDKTRRRVSVDHVADAMRALFIGTNWDLVSSTVEVRGGTVAALEMNIQHFDKTPVDKQSRFDFIAIFAEWVSQIGFNSAEWEMTIVEVVTEKDAIPMYGGRFGREGLSN